MSVSNELLRPETSDKFEALCLALYGQLWNDPGCMPMGGSGQVQFGLDIIGKRDGQSVGVQCKHYNKKPFTLATITDDLEKADKAGIQVSHLVFATTAPAKSDLVLKVMALSEERSLNGKFTVSVDFWDAISTYLRVHSDIARAFIPNFPGSDVIRARDAAEGLADNFRIDVEERKAYEVESLQGISVANSGISEILSRLDHLEATSKGSESNELLARQLDLVRDQIRKGRFHEAQELLSSLETSVKTADRFSQFRWHTSRAACLLSEGCEADAAKEYLTAFDYAPEEEKALANRARAYLLQKYFMKGLQSCDEGLEKYPNSGILWALKINARIQLNEVSPEEGVPENLLDDSEVLFALAHLHYRRGNYLKSYELAKRCCERDGSSLEAKRVVLSAALSWATDDPVLAHYGQLSEGKLEAVKSALVFIEPVEETLTSIQSAMVSEEITNNTAVALLLAGQIERSREIATQGLRRHPFAEGLLRIRINELDSKADITGIRALTETRLADLPTDVLITLIEISANHGDMNWFNALHKALDGRELDERKSSEIFALSVHANWAAGRQGDAVAMAKASLESRPDQLLLTMMQARMLRKQGLNADSEELARRSLTMARKTSVSVDLLNVAELLYDFHMFFEAAELYRRLAPIPNGGKLTQRQLICLVESDQREKARRIVESLAPEVRELSPFRRIEANLAQAAGDWARMRDLLKREYEVNPSDSVALGYVGALYRLQENEELRSVLASNPVFAQARPENEFEFAKYQANNGYAELAVRRLYRLFRENPQDTRIAGFYLTILLLLTDEKSFPTPTEAGDEVAVQIRYQHDLRWIAVDEAGLPAISSWPELVPAGTPAAASLVGKTIGETIQYETPFGKVEAEIVGLESLVQFAARKAQEVIAASAAQAGPLWSVNIGKQDGQLDLEPILESLRRRSKYVESLFSHYQKQRFPLSILAKALGADPVTLLLEWPYQHATMFVGIGTHEEREQGKQILNEGGQRFVLDLLTLTELARWDLLEKAIKIIGPPLIPQTVKEQLLGLLQLVENHRASATMREESGQFYMVDIPDSYYEERKAFLQKMLKFLNTHCEVVPTHGPVRITRNHRLLAEVLDPASLDVIYLTIEHKGVLLSEDGALRLMALEAGAPKTLGLQPLLMHMKASGVLTQSEYSSTILRKLSIGHDFISVAAEDMGWAAQQSPNQFEPLVRTVLKSFEQPSLDVGSGVTVCNEFIKWALTHLKPKLVRAYFDACLKALCLGREDFAKPISRVLAINLVSELSQLGNPKKTRLANELKDYFHLAQTSMRPRLKELVRSIRLGFS